MTQYLKGDATAPQVDGPAVIVHVCHDEGKWGKGFVLAVSRRWSEPERVYRSAEAGLEKVAEFSARQKAVVAMPRIGAGLAGGKWEEVEKIVAQALRGVQAHVYDL